MRKPCLIVRREPLATGVAYPWRRPARLGVGPHTGSSPDEEATMAKGQMKSNKESRKPKAEKVKTNASNPSAKGPVGLVNLKD